MSKKFYKICSGEDICTEAVKDLSRAQDGENCRVCGRDLEQVPFPPTWLEKHSKIIIATVTAIAVVGGVVLWITSREPKVEINPKNATIEVGKTVNLTAKPQNMEWTWKSSDESIATVSRSGVVAGISKGDAKITVTAERKGKPVLAEVTVTVENGSQPCTTCLSIMPLVSVEIVQKNPTVRVGASETLTVKTEPENTDVKWNWASSDVNKATVNESGTVRGVAEGNSTITVTAENHKCEDCGREHERKNILATVTVTVQPPGCPSPGTITYTFGRYEGALARIGGNCIPEGQGTMYYTSRVQIAKHGRNEYFAEAGDTFVGTWGNGDIVNGILYDRNNNQKASILAGKRPNPYDLRQDR